MLPILGSVAQVPGWLELDGTADRPGAAEVDVARFEDEGEIEVFDGDDRVLKPLDMRY